MSVKPPKPIEIFYSYSHKDEELRDELEKHLSILKRQGVITGWHDRRIGAGREWAGEIDTHLNTADVILLLISSDFLASDYCYDVEMKRAMERHEAGEARVIPVILRPVDWRGAPFGKLQALPTDAKPVTSWANRDEAFLDVAQGIRPAVEEPAGLSVSLPPLSEIEMRLSDAKDDPSLAAQYFSKATQALILDDLWESKRYYEMALREDPFHPRASEQLDLVRRQIEQRAGDRAIQIGQVFGNVVFQFLSPKAAMSILAALAIAAISLFCLYRMAQKPTRMTGDFKVAVAQFGEVTDEGIVSSALATQISKLLFDFLDTEYKATDFGLDIQVTHKKIGILTEDREAEQLAYDIGADIVIYGSVFVIGDEAILSPKFYIADQPDTGELTGQHQLALPIRFDISSLDFQDEVNTELHSRAAILISFTEGLVYLSADDLDEALHCFREAIREAESHDPFEGQEVLYLLAATTSRLQGNLEKATEYLDKALSLNPEYARAYIGRGNIYYDQVLPSWDQAKLDKALSEYERALEAQDHPAGAYIREKVNTSLGNIYVIQAQQTNDPELFAQAIHHYDQVVAQYEKTKNERIKEMAATAYLGLGAAYERQNDYTQAADAYQRCIDLTSDSELKSRAERQLGLIKGQN